MFISGLIFVGMGLFITIPVVLGIIVLVTSLIGAAQVRARASPSPRSSPSLPLALWSP